MLELSARETQFMMLVFWLFLGFIAPFAFLLFLSERDESRRQKTEVESETRSER